jgi:oxygen-independent coproporphyrinogen III oxidase
LPLLKIKSKSKIVNKYSLAGVYIHIPFCKKACHYCNFHFSTSASYKNDMVQAIIKEIELTSFINDTNSGQVIETIYFGGGTPSILSPMQLQQLLAAVRQKFTVQPQAEITLEANPDDINEKSLQQWQMLGINRLSVGIQSFNDAELLWMNRAHNATESVHCIDMITSAGFTNFSIDLIYGSPLLSNYDWQQHVELVIDKKAPHVSCYALTVEPKTALNKMIALKKTAPVDAEKQAAQFLLLMQWMQQAGYQHYEISNYALPGMRSRHNSSYWSGSLYYGFGPSAHAYNGHSRSWNVAHNMQYMQAIQNNTIPKETELLTTTQQLNEYIMTALRTMEGISIHTVTTLFGEQQANRLIQQSSKYQHRQQVLIRQQHIILTNDGKLFADGIAADLFA